MKIERLAAVTSAIVLLAATSASAALLDFTKGSGSTTGSINGIGYTISASPGHSITFDRRGPGATGVLAGDNDGIGVRDDEIGGGEYVTITFDRSVKLTALHFLDLFRARNGASSEAASVYAGTPPDAGGFAESFAATETYRPGGAGYGAFTLGTPLTGNTFSFDSGIGNDGVGIGDFALAALELGLVPVPLPASATLLGGAVGAGLLAARRRRRKA